MGMSISLKKDGKKTSIKHNNRKMNEEEKKKNGHIDFSRSDENKYLVSKSLKELYKNEFGQAQKDYNDKQKRADRKIDNYYEHIQKGKKTSLQQEMILQVGGQDDFSENPENQKIANEVLEEWFQKFEERNPNLKVYNAVIHNDEASPHMHLNFVPVATGYKRGMDKQVSFDKAIFQQDNSLNKERPFEEWRNKEVQLLEKMLKERGIERDLVGTNSYRDVRTFKKEKDELRELEVERASLQEDVQELSKVVKSTKALDSIEVETGGLFNRKTVKLSLEDFESIKTLATGSEGLKKEITSLNLDKGLLGMQIHELKAEKEVLKTENTELKTKNAELKSENENLEIKNTELEEQVTKLEMHFNHLKRTVGILKGNAERYLKIGNEKMREFIGYSRLHDLTEKFGKEIAFMPVNLKGMIPEDEVQGAEKYMDKINEKELEKEREEVLQEKEKVSKGQNRKEPNLEDERR